MLTVVAPPGFVRTPQATQTVEQRGKLSVYVKDWLTGASYRLTKIGNAKAFS
jgi:hypothetical protein